jgi:hypothetical protein
MSDKKSRPLVKEQPHQLKAFEHYVSLGEHRSCEKVAAEFGVAQSTVKLWSKSFDWQDRIRERDVQIAREVATRTLTDDTNRRERSLQIIHLALVQLAKAVVEGSVKMSLGDLDRLIRLESFLNDLPDSRSEVVFGDLKGKSDEELRQMVRREVETLKELEADHSEMDCQE